MRKNVNAEFVTALCRSKEKDLITEEKFDRIMSAETASDALRMIRESGFGGDVKTETVQDYENLIGFEEEELSKFVRDYCPDESFSEYYLLKNDYHNAESLLRANYLNVSPSAMLGREGKYTIEQLQTFFSGKKRVELSEELLFALEKGKFLFENKEATGFTISNLFIKQRYKEALKIALKNKILYGFVKREIDALNISTALRSRNERILEISFIEGGDLCFEEIKPLAVLDYSVIITKYKGNKYENLIVSATEAAKTERPFVKFENLLDSYALSELKKNKYMAFGLEEFMLYTFYKLNEIKNVRIVMVGIIGKSDKAEIKTRVRENYAG